MIGDDQVAQLLALQAQQNSSMMGGVMDGGAGPGGAFVNPAVSPMMNPYAYGNPMGGGYGFGQPSVDPSASSARSYLGTTSFGANAPMTAAHGAFELGAFGATTGALGGPLGIGASFVDPFGTGGLSIAGAASGAAAWMGASGLGTGSGMGRLMSGGRALMGGATGIGGLSTGLMAAGAGMLGGIAMYKGAEMAVSFATENINAGIMQQSNLQNMLMSPNRELMPKMGGVSPDDVYGVRGMFSAMAEADSSMSVDSLTQISSSMMQRGEFKDSTSIDDFKVKFRKTLESLKDVSAVLNTSLEEAYEFMDNQKQMGIFNKTDQVANIVLSKEMGRVGGISMDTMQQGGVFGAQVARAYGASPIGGAVTMERSMGMTGLALREGTISDEDLYMATGASGEVGVSAFSQQMMQQAMQFGHGRRGKLLTAALMDSETGHIDSELSKTYAAGGLDHADIVKMARENLSTREGRLAFRANRRQLVGELVQDVGPTQLMAQDTENILNRHFGTTNLDPEEEQYARTILQRKYTGMSDAQADMMMDIAQDAPRLRVKSQIESSRAMAGMGVGVGKVPTLGEIKDAFISQTFSPISRGLQNIGAGIEANITQWFQEEMYGGVVTVGADTDAAFTKGALGQTGSISDEYMGYQAEAEQAFLSRGDPTYRGRPASTLVTDSTLFGNVSTVVKPTRDSRGRIDPIMSTLYGGVQAGSFLADMPASMMKMIDYNISQPNISGMSVGSLKSLESVGLVEKPEWMTKQQLAKTDNYVAVQRYGNNVEKEYKSASEGAYDRPVSGEWEVGTEMLYAFSESALDFAETNVAAASSILGLDKNIIQDTGFAFEFGVSSVAGVAEGEVGDPMAMYNYMEMRKAQSPEAYMPGEAGSQMLVRELNVSQEEVWAYVHDTIELSGKLDKELATVDPTGVMSEASMKGMFYDVNRRVASGSLGITNNDLAEAGPAAGYDLLVGGLRQDGMNAEADKIDSWVNAAPTQGERNQRKMSVVHRTNSAGPMDGGYGLDGVEPNIPTASTMIANRNDLMRQGETQFENLRKSNKSGLANYTGSGTDIPNIDKIAMYSEQVRQGDVLSESKDKEFQEMKIEAQNHMRASGLSEGEAANALNLIMTDPAASGFRTTMSKAGTTGRQAEYMKAQEQLQGQFGMMTEGPAIEGLQYVRGGGRAQEAIRGMAGDDFITFEEYGAFYDEITAIALDPDMTSDERDRMADMLGDMGPQGMAASHVVRTAKKHRAQGEKIVSRTNFSSERSREKAISQMMDPFLKGEGSAALKSFILEGQKRDEYFDISSEWGFAKMLEMTSSDEQRAALTEMRAGFREGATEEDRERMLDKYAGARSQVTPSVAGTYAGGAGGDFLAQLDPVLKTLVDVQEGQVLLLDRLNKEKEP